MARIPPSPPPVFFSESLYSERKSVFSARISDAVPLACACRRILALELSKNLPYFSQFTVEVHFHKRRR
jgi:hypothetical protein